MKCTRCGAENHLSAEDIHYYRQGGLIVEGTLITCPHCIEHEISFTAEPYSRVIPMPSFSMDAMFSPLNSDIVVTIKPFKD